jgi:hypothetical protein
MVNRWRLPAIDHRFFSIARSAGSELLIAAIRKIGE